MKHFDTGKNMPLEDRVQPVKKQTKSSGRHKTDEKIKRDYFATEIATELQDEKSLGCYRVIAEKIPQTIIFETLASVKETWKEGKIQKSRGALFVDMIKTYSDKKNIELNFADGTVRKKHIGKFQ